MVFWRFQEDQKVTLGRKGLNAVAMVLKQSKFKLQIPWFNREPDQLKKQVAFSKCSSSHTVLFATFRSRHSPLLFKIDALRKFAIFTGEHLCCSPESLQLNQKRGWSISACVYSNHATLFLIISSRVRTAVIDIKWM